MTFDQLPEKLRVPGVKLVQPGEQPKETIILKDADIEYFAQVFKDRLKQDQRKGA